MRIRPNSHCESDKKRNFPYGERVRGQPLYAKVMLIFAPNT